MFRYLAFVWNPSDPGATAAKNKFADRITAQKTSVRQPWNLILHQMGLEVYCTGTDVNPNRIYTLQNGAGVVLGTLFKRSGIHSSEAARLFDEASTAEILATHGRILIRDYWGRYAAFGHDPATHTTWALRDPAGGMPCWHTQSSGVDIYFSRMEDVLALGAGPYSVDWPFVIAHLCHQKLEVRRTGLQQVSNVLGGECVLHERVRTHRRLHWNALQVAVAEPLEDIRQAIDDLYETTVDCVRAWASHYSGIVLTLSGGLDSSIVLACLKDVRTADSLTCLNHYSSGGSDSDEREYARLSASHAGYPLLEVPRNPMLNFDALARMPRHPVPLNYRYYLENSQQETHIARQRNATILFNGEGGDQLFYQSRGSFAPGDYIHDHGLLRSLGPKLFEAAFAAARMDRLSLWRVLRATAQQHFKSTPWTPATLVARLRKWLNPDMVRQTLQDYAWAHPGFIEAPPAPNGKRWHAHALQIPAAEFYDPLIPEAAADRLSPLFSQPLIELCLRIPTYVLIAGGWDRAIARRAFEPHLPPQIATRRSKGGVTDYGKAVLRQNAAFVRELLSDGLLVQQGILDAEQLRRRFSGDPASMGADVELYDYVNTETWLRRWR